MSEALLATISAVVGFGAKALWDWFYARERERESLALNKRVDFLERQLSEFYWPLYIRLEKDNVVWRRILDVREQDEAKRRIATEIERGVILPNHDEILKLLESHMHLAQADSELMVLLLQYINHVTLYKALRAAGDDRTFPLSLGVGWPHNLFPTIQQRTERLQREYDALLQRNAAPTSAP